MSSILFPQTMYIFLFKQKNAFFLVLLFREIHFQPELSSPTRFRIQGGGCCTSMTQDGQRKKDECTKLIVNNIEFVSTNFCHQNIFVCLQV